MANNLNKPATFEDVKVGQPFIEVLSPANYVYRRCNELVDGKKTVNARHIQSGRVAYKYFADWEPVFIELRSLDMPRNMSFYHTQEQIKNQTKTVTRRLGWLFLKPGDILNACEKCQGLRKGDKIKRFGQIRVTNVRREPLNAITAEDCTGEGLPWMRPGDFVEFFCKAMNCKPTTVVTRIEFEYI